MTYSAKIIDLRGVEISLKTAACGYANTVSDPEEADQRDQAWEDLKKWALAYAVEVKNQANSVVEVPVVELVNFGPPPVGDLAVDSVEHFRPGLDVSELWTPKKTPGDVGLTLLGQLALTHDFAVVHTKKTPTLPERTKLLIDAKYGRFGIK